MIKPVRSFVRAEAEGNQRISAHSSLARWPVPLPPVGGFAAGECLHRKLCSVPSPGFMPFPTGPPPLSRLEMGNTLADLRSCALLPQAATARLSAEQGTAVDRIENASASRPK